MVAGWASAAMQVAKQTSREDSPLMMQLPQLQTWSTPPRPAVTGSEAAWSLATSAGLLETTLHLVAEHRTSAKSALRRKARIRLRTKPPQLDAELQAPGAASTPGVAPSPPLKETQLTIQEE